MRIDGEREWTIQYSVSIEIVMLFRGFRNADWDCCLYRTAILADTIKA